MLHRKYDSANENDPIYVHSVSAVFSGHADIHEYDQKHLLAPLRSVLAQNDPEVIDAWVSYLSYALKEQLRHRDYREVMIELYQVSLQVEPISPSYLKAKLSDLRNKISALGYYAVITPSRKPEATRLRVV